MLGKLIKYELKASARTFFPLYLVLILVSIINKFTFANFNVLNPSFPINSFFILVYLALILAIFAITTLIILQRFFKNLLGNEGYLMFTLPVSTSKIVFSKIIANTIWSFLSFLMISVSMLISFSNAIILDSIYQLVTAEFFKYFAEILPYIIEYILIALLSLWSFITLNYAALSLGHLVGRNKILSSVGAYILLSILTSLATQIVYFILGNPFIFNWVYSLTYTMQMHLYLISSILGLAVAAAVYFSISIWVLKNKLNLE